LGGRERKKQKKKNIKGGVRGGPTVAGKQGISQANPQGQKKKANKKNGEAGGS